MIDFNIVTFHRAYNYGAVLQAYALQSFIKNLGYTSGIYDYVSPFENKNSGLKGKVLKRIQGKSVEYDKYIHSAYNEFVTKELNLNNENDSKVYVSGSDQVWNPCGPMDMTYYLDFVKDNSSCISYAASLGVPIIPEKRKLVIKDAIDRFDYISVREESAKEQLSYLTMKDISVNIDPSLLIESKDWYPLMKEVNDIPNDYILVYIMHYPKNLNKLLKWLTDNTGLKVVLLESQGVIQGNLCSLVYNNKVIKSASPYEFLWLFKNAKYVVTSSFHGVAFSIVFHKEFYAIINEESDSRISNLLKKCNVSWVSEKDKSFKKKKIDWEFVDEYLTKERSNAENYLIEAYNHASEKESISVKDNIAKVYNNCSGCSACSIACPVNAIIVELNNEGFYKASVDNVKCIKCGRCRDICPSVKPIHPNVIQSYYGFNTDEGVLKKSSSGGVFHALSTEILRGNGVVYSAVYSDDSKAVLFGCSDSYKLESFQKSKYITSDFRNVINQVKKHLSVKNVLVCAAPCQIAGLMASFEKRPENLLTIDFVCGGMPSATFWSEHVEYVERKFKSRLSSVDFRSKEKEWGKMLLELSFQNGHKKFFREYQDSYYNSFLNYLSLDNRCLSCQYHEVHCSDITLADFWGYKSAGVCKNKNGLSLILCNTDKGEKAVIDNPNLTIKKLDNSFAAYALGKRVASGAHIAKRNEFFKTAKEKSFEDAAKIMCPIGTISHIKPFVLNKLGR